MLTPQQIRQLRESLGWSTMKLAYELGVTENTVHRWEGGQRYPRRVHLAKLNQLLKQAQEERGLVLA